MVKKEWIFSILLVLLLIPFTSAVNETQIDEGYSCLNDRIDQRTCEKMSLEEQIFSSLAVGKCTDEILDNAESPSEGEECWSGEHQDCQVDKTAKAILALDKAGKSTENSVNWLSSQNKTPEELRWYLQAQTSEKPASCDITYNENTYTVQIDEDDQFSSEAGNCLLLSDNGYWLSVSSQCYGTEFDISCNSSFSTNLLFREEDSSTINILGETSSASEGGTTTEVVNSLCFEEGGRCSYEGTLWAASVLDYLGRDISNYKPYINALRDNQRQYLPSAFLYSLTGKQLYSDELMDLRSPAGYWEESGNRYYDTSIAMNALQESGVSGLEDTEEWLIDEQDEEGCWNNENIEETAFILYSTWPRENSSPGESETICSDVGFCVGSSECSEEDKLPEYKDTCSGTKICCSEEPEEGETCSDLEGEICSYDEYCSEGTESYAASDLESGEICCVDGGTCKATEEPENDTEDEEGNCVENGGTCRSNCYSDETESTTYTCSGDDNCCMPAEEEGEGLPWWIWVLIVLIVLSVLAIIFKDKLKELWLKMKTKFGKGKGRGSGKQGPRGPGGRPPGQPSRGRPQQRNVPRRVMPRQQQPQQPQRPRKRKGSKELDDVLGKLKDMSK